jgi:hypothetical protein
MFNIKRTKKTVLVDDIKIIHNYSNLEIINKFKDSYIFIVDDKCDFIKYVDGIYYLNKSVITSDYIFYKIITNNANTNIYNGLNYEII